MDRMFKLVLITVGAILVIAVVYLMHLHLGINKQAKRIAEEHALYSKQLISLTSGKKKVLRPKLGQDSSKVRTSERRETRIYQGEETRSTELPERLQAKIERLRGQEDERRVKQLAPDALQEEERLRALHEEEYKKQSSLEGKEELDLPL